MDGGDDLYRQPSLQCRGGGQECQWKSVLQFNTNTKYVSNG